MMRCPALLKVAVLIAAPIEATSAYGIFGRLPWLVHAHVQSKKATRDDPSRSDSESDRLNAHSLVQIHGGGNTRLLRRRLPAKLEYRTSRYPASVAKTWSVQSSQGVLAPSAPAPPKLTTTSRNSSILSKIDVSVALVYFCSSFCITLPVILTPVIGDAHQLTNSALTSFCATVASVGILGGGIGKLINGVVCQSLGGTKTATYYLLGAALSSCFLSFSTSADSIKWFVASMEFFVSAMWVACSLILGNYYDKQPLLFARGVTYLSLASTAAQFLAKTLGSGLINVMGWRKVAQIGSLMALAGSILVKTVVAKEVKEPKKRVFFRSDFGLVDKIKQVLGNRLFWTFGVAHVSGFIARTSDRMMGPFIKEITSFSYEVCGALTASLTLGFVYGVMKGQAFYKLDSVSEKRNTLTRWYLQAGAAILGLAVIASKQFQTLGFSPHLLAVLIVLCSGVLSSSVAFQFFQIPNLVSSVAFSTNKAICLSYLDGLGSFLTAPLWAASSRLVAGYGWSATWMFLAIIYSLTSLLMMIEVPAILTKHAKL